MTISIKNLPKSSTYELLKEKTGRKDRINTFITQIATTYPTTNDRITQFWKDNGDEFKKFGNKTTYEEYLEFFRKFDGEQDLIDLIKPAIVKKIDELLIEKFGGEDNEILGELKATARDKKHIDELPKYFNDATGGVTYFLFLYYLIDNVYLVDSTDYIDKELKENGVELKELNKGAWQTEKDALFFNIYSTFINTEQQSDLDDLLEGVNKAYEDIRLFIVKARQRKESDIEDKIKNLTDDKKLLEADKKKLAEDNKDLKDAGKLAAQRISDLEADNNTLKDQIAKGGGTPTPPPGPTPPSPVIAGAEEWKATALFLTEPNFGKAIKLFNDLYNKKWTYEQRQAIYTILKANKDNREYSKGKWGQRFNY